MKNSQQLKKERTLWLEDTDPSRGFERFFDYLPGVSIFAKNVDGVLMRGNASFLARFGFQDESELIGKTDYDLFPATMADNYRKDDHEVMDSAQPKLNIIETFFNRQGLPDWYLAHKLPVLSRTNEVIGVMGMIKSHKAKSGHEGGHAYERLAPAIEYIQKNFRNRINIQELANLTNLSLRQFGRSFKDYYGTTPQKFLIKTRIQAACEALRYKDVDLASLAVELGFYDQSSFTLHFRRNMGITPRRFREREGGQNQ